MSDFLVDADFLSGMRDVKKGLIVKPLVHNYLFDAKFPAFEMVFPAHEMFRGHDGWFHPSTHPLWPAMALYHYLARPEQVEPEVIGYMGAMSITVGKAMHGFVNVCMRDIGIMPEEMNRCTTCPEGKCPQDGTEPGVVDEEAGSRGHCDGLLDLAPLSVPKHLEYPVFEFKTTNERRMKKIEDLDDEEFRRVWPEYWAQQQELMRMTGRETSLVLMMHMGHPWALREFHIRADKSWQMATRTKYMEVRQAVADQRPIRCCGAYKSCPTGKVCESVLG